MYRKIGFLFYYSNILQTNEKLHNSLLFYRSRKPGYCWIRSRFLDNNFQIIQDVTSTRLVKHLTLNVERP